MRPLKIAIYSQVIPATPFVENLILELSNHHNVYVFGTLKSPIQYKNTNIKVVETSTKQWRNIPQTLWRSVRLLFKSPSLLFWALKEAKRYKSPYECWMRYARFVPVLLYKPDIFHLQWASKIDRWMFLSKAFNCKIVLALLGSNINVDPISNKELKDYYQKHFPNIDAFQAVSEDLKKKALELGAPPDKVHIAYTVLNQGLNEHFKSRNNRSEKLQLVSVGRHHWVKGYKYALKALALLKVQNVRVHYTIIANGKVPDELRFYVQEYNLQDCVTFQSGMHQKELFKSLLTFDALLLPSLSEGIANVALEAMFLGLPVIASDCGGMSEIIKPKQTGWLFSIADAKNLAQTIQDFMATNPDKKEQIIQQAFQTVSTQFNPKEVIKQYLNIYEALIKKE